MPKTKHDFKKDDIVFLSPLSRLVLHRYALGVLTLSSHLREKGFDNIIIEPHKLTKKKIKFYDMDNKLRKELETNLIRMMANKQPKYICITAATSEFNEAADMIKRIRDVCANSKIIVGGYHVNAVPEDFLHYGADFTVYGEGEITLHELIKRLEEGKKDFANIDGLGWRNKNKAIVNKPRTPISDLDIIPLPAYDKIDMKYYIRMWDGTVRGFPLKACKITTSRGCPYDCCFCGCPITFGRKVRYHGAERIEKEVKLLKEKYGIEGIMVTDDTLTINKDHLRKVCKIMKKYNMVWDCQARVNTFDEEMACMLKDAGCLQVCFGVESGSQRILDDIIEKRITVEEARIAYKICKKHGLSTMANFMIGLPTETRAEMEKTLQLAKELNANYYCFSIATPLPGTRLYDMIGVKIKPEEYYKLDWTTPHIKEFNRSEVKDVIALGEKFHNQLKGIMLRNGLLNVPKFIHLWLVLPNKTKRIFYVFRKFYNMFIFRPIFKRSLRL